MTVPSTASKSGPFLGDGAATSFVFDFKVFTKADIEVVLTDTSGVDTTLVLDSDYSVVLNTDQNTSPGGTVTYPITGNPLPTGASLVVARDVAYTQETDITNAGGFYPQVIEDALDKSVMLIQQLLESTSRAVGIPLSEDGGSFGLQVPSASKRASQFLAFDANGNVVVSDGTGADAGLRTDLASTDPSKGAALVGNSVQLVSDLSVLRTINPTISRNCRIRDGAEYYASTGQPAGTYVDNAGSVIVPTGGDGSSAWLIVGQKDVLHIEDFGGDLVAAFNALPDAGGIIYAGAGTFSVTQPINTATSHKKFYIIGAGPDVTIFDFNFSTVSDALTFHSATNVQIRDCTLRKTAGSADSGIVCSAQILLKNVILDGFSNDNMQLVAPSASSDAPYFSLLENCWFINSGGSGLAINQNANGIVWLNCQAKSNAFHGVENNSGFSNQFIGGQCAYNAKSGLYITNAASYITILGLYAEGNNTSSGPWTDINVDSGCYDINGFTGTLVGGVDLAGTSAQNSTLFKGSQLVSEFHLGLQKLQFGDDGTNTFYAEPKNGTSGFGGTLNIGSTGTGGTLRIDNQSQPSAYIFNDRFMPEVDNLVSTGGPSNRWSVVYAGSGTINTSDASEKQDIRSLSEKEKTVALKLKSKIRAFRFKDAVKNKGDGARTHIGVIAQDVEKAFTDEGLDGMKYGVLCYDEWDDENGNKINRYGVRYDELTMFILAAT